MRTMTFLPTGRPVTVLGIEDGFATLKDGPFVVVPVQQLGPYCGKVVPRPMPTELREKRERYTPRKSKDALMEQLVKNLHELVLGGMSITKASNELAEGTPWHGANIATVYRRQRRAGKYETPPLSKGGRESWAKGLGQ